MFQAVLITGRVALHTKMHATCVYDPKRNCEIYDTCAFCMLLSNVRFNYFASRVPKEELTTMRHICLHMSVPEKG